MPRGFQEVKVPRLRDNAQDGGKVVSLTHRPLLPPGNTPGTHFIFLYIRTFILFLSFKNDVFKCLKMVSTTERCSMC